MNPYNDILEELKELGSPLARFPRNLPFLIPEGYFNALPEDSLEQIFDSQRPDPQLMWPKALPFAVPQHYFAQLPQEILEGIAAAAVTEKPLSFPKTMPFAVPEGYFETLPEELTMMVSAPAQDLLATPETPFAVPEGYFAGFAENLMSRIRGEEANAVEAIPAPVVAATPARRTISILPAFRWAAAALLILGIGAGSYMGLRDNRVTMGPATAIDSQMDIAGQLASLDRAAIVDYVEQNIDEFDMETLEIFAPASLLNGKSAEQSLKQLDAKAVEDYLDATGEL